MERPADRQTDLQTDTVRKADRQRKDKQTDADRQKGIFHCVISDVPQGSVIGPLLLILYMNDLDSLLSANDSIKLIADDLKIYASLHTPFQCCSARQIKFT